MLKTFLLSIAAFAAAQASHAQCFFADTARVTGDTLFCNGGDDYKSVVAYNPVDSIYYSVNAGGATDNEYYNYQGQYLGSSTNADFRGLWYNSSTGLLEGNCWDHYFAVDSMTTEGYFSSRTAAPFGAGGVTSPPFMQCAGVFDYDANTILYYYNDTLWGESRADLVDITPVALSGQSLNNVLSAGLIFTGCAGKEIGLFDYVDNKLYLFNKNTGALAQTIAVPLAPTTATTYYYGLGFANNIFWLFDATNNKWIGFDIFGTPTGLRNPQQAATIQVYPNPTTNQIYFSAPTAVSLFAPDGRRLAYRTAATDLDMSALPAGIYLVQLHDEAGRSTQLHKIIKQ